MLVVVVSVWFVLAPKLHRWPFEERPIDAAGKPEPWLGELTETDDPDAAPLATFRVVGDASDATPHDHATG